VRPDHEPVDLLDHASYDYDAAAMVQALKDMLDTATISSPAN